MTDAWQPAVALLGNVTVQSGAGLAGLARIEISVFVPKKGSAADYVISVPENLGSVSASGPADFRKAGGTRILVISLNNGVTDSQVQDFLRSIAFASTKMDPAKKPLGRRINVRVFDSSNVSSNVISTEIVARKK